MVTGPGWGRVLLCPNLGIAWSPGAVLVRVGPWRVVWWTDPVTPGVGIRDEDGYVWVRTTRFEIACWAAWFEAVEGLEIATLDDGRNDP